MTIKNALMAYDAMQVQVSSQFYAQSILSHGITFVGGKYKSSVFKQIACLVVLFEAINV